MKQDKLSKVSIIIYTLGLIPVVWLAILTAPCFDGGLRNIITNLGEVFKAPFHLTWCDKSLVILGIFIGLYLICIIIYVTSTRNYRRTEEHGSAKWGRIGQLRKYKNRKEPQMAKILTQHTSISLKSREHRHNLNILVVGGSGAGKTRFFAKPNVLQANCSMVVLDPKGL